MGLSSQCFTSICYGSGIRKDRDTIVVSADTLPASIALCCMERSINRSTPSLSLVAMWSCCRISWILFYEFRHLSHMHIRELEPFHWVLALGMVCFVWFRPPAREQSSNRHHLIVVISAKNAFQLQGVKRQKQQLFRDKNNRKCTADLQTASTICVSELQTIQEGENQESPCSIFSLLSSIYQLEEDQPVISRSTTFRVNSMGTKIVGANKQFSSSKH
jgi:hypothetical protein